MSKRHVFSGVTAETLGRLPQWDDGSFELQLDWDRIGGTLIRHTGLGDVVVRFDHDLVRGNDGNDREEADADADALSPLLLAEMSLAWRCANGEL